VLALPAFVIALDFSVLNLAVPVISRELMPTGTELLWIVDIYGFILAGFLVTMGTLGDRIGRRRLLMIGAAGFADAVRSALATRTASAVGVKSIAAYRTGLDLNPERPSDAEVTAAAGRWLAALTGPPRIADQTLQRFLIWCGVDLGLPVQFHVGYGDSDVDLHRCNPLLLTPLLRAIQPAGTPVMLLHNYPFHREAGYLAQVFPHVYVDAGLATHNLGRRAPALLAEALELAPFGKFLYSSDAFGLPELYYLGAALFRAALSGFLTSGLEEDHFSERTVVRLTRMLCADNAKRAYQLGDQM